jgi:hypothetical protein
MRFTAAISIPGSTPVRLETEGWSLSPDAIHPDEAPGFRVTRYSGRTLIGFAEGYSLLPVVPGLPESFARNKVALAPTDLVLAPYEDLGQVNLDPLRDFPLDAEEWSWLFETVADEVRRRSIPFGALVGPDSRGIRFGRDVQIGDILLVDGRPTILQLDEGNGWLDEGDRVLTTISGRVRFGPLAETPGTIKILRPRLFITLRERVKDAGYGHTGQVAWYTADLGQALREFQRDQGLPETGYPDAATDAALERLLTAMESVPSPPASGQ